MDRRALCIYWRTISAIYTFSPGVFDLASAALAELKDCQDLSYCSHAESNPAHLMICARHPTKMRCRHCQLAHSLSHAVAHWTCVACRVRPATVPGYVNTSAQVTVAALPPAVERGVSRRLVIAELDVCEACASSARTA
jgi:hypothetical protein